MAPLTSILSPFFPQFNALPTEIRLQIWGLNLSSRIIDIHAFSKKLAPGQERNSLKDDRVYTAQSGIPLLYVCKESREFILELYKYGVDTEDQSSPRFQRRRDEFPSLILMNWNGRHLPCRTHSHSIPGEIRPRIYFNLEHDVFCLRKVWWFVGRSPLYPLRNYFTDDIFLNLRYLALPFGMFAWAVDNDLWQRESSGSERSKRVTLVDFPNLREILINVDDKEDEYGDHNPDQISDEEIKRALEDFAQRNPTWKIPKWRLVKDRASIEKIVDQGLLA